MAATSLLRREYNAVSRPPPTALPARARPYSAPAFAARPCRASRSAKDSLDASEESGIAGGELFQLTDVEPDALTARALVDLDASVRYADQRRATLGASALADRQDAQALFLRGSPLAPRQRCFATLELLTGEVLLFRLRWLHWHCQLLPLLRGRLPRVQMAARI